MRGNSTLTTALVVAGIVLVLAPALVPIPTVLVHDTRPAAFEGPDELRQQGYTIVAYENLSERGRELYVEALRSGGRYSVASGSGASDYPYSTADAGERTGRYDPSRGAIVIERPSDGDLPPPDEPVEMGRAAPDAESGGESATGGPPTAGEIGRYDLIRTRTGMPPIGDPASLARLLSAAAGVVLIGIGGYRGSQPN